MNVKSQTKNKIDKLILSEFSKKGKNVLPLNQIICGDVIEGKWGQSRFY